MKAQLPCNLSPKSNSGDDGIYCALEVVLWLMAMTATIAAMNAAVGHKISKCAVHILSEIASPGTQRRATVRFEPSHTNANEFSENVVLRKAFRLSEDLGLRPTE